MLRPDGVREARVSSSIKVICVYLLKEHHWSHINELSFNQ